MNTPENQSLPISALQHLAYCPRQCALIHLERQWEENTQTAQGRMEHNRVHEGYKAYRRGKRQITGLSVVSETLGLHGQLDVLELDLVDASGPDNLSGFGVKGTWRVYPVEFKHGQPKKNDCDRIQLCAQVLCVEEMLDVTIEQASLFYQRTRQREDVDMDALLRGKTLRLAGVLHDLFDKGRTPPPVHDARCRGCSLEERCMPKRLSTENRYKKSPFHAPGGGMKHMSNTLYVTQPGSFLFKEGNTVVVKQQERRVMQLPVHTIGQIVCFGFDIILTPPLMAFCAESRRQHCLADRNRAIPGPCGRSHQRECAAQARAASLGGRPGPVPVRGPKRGGCQDQQRQDESATVSSESIQPRSRRGNTDSDRPACSPLGTGRDRRINGCASGDRGRGRRGLFFRFQSPHPPTEGGFHLLGPQPSAAQGPGQCHAFVSLHLAGF